MHLTLAEISRILDVPGPASDTQVAGYSIDSRTIQPGELFFAIRGPRFDGHDFVAGVLAGGAAAAVVEQAGGPGTLVVPSVPEALNRLAAEHRRRWSGRVVAVTGSAGKTSTKDMIATVLASRFKVLKSEGNLNNQYGLPLSVLRLNATHQVGVFELGMSHAGEIAKLARIAQPDTGVVTCVAPVHLEYFASVEGIAHAKQELIFALPKNGHAILNADDRYVSTFGIGFEGYKVSFGMEKAADFRATHVESEGLKGVRFCLQWEGEPVEVRLPLLGRQNILNALAAMATAHTFGIYPRQTREALLNYRTPKMRGEVQTARGATIINDCYNSNPRALAFMLQSLAETPAVGRRIAVLGEMLELGPASPDLHRESGKLAARSADIVIGVRGDARHLVDGAIEAGLEASHARFFASTAEAGDYVASLVQSGDLLLFKGSRGVRLEEALSKIAGE